MKITLIVGVFSLLKSTVKNLEQFFFKILNKGHRWGNDVIILSTIANRNVSSANNLMLFDMPPAISLIYNKNKKGPSNGPWGTPE